MSTTAQFGRPAASHPFRQSLRFAVLKRRTRFVPEPSLPGGFSMQDLREFLMAYCACFLAVSTFIA